MANLVNEMFEKANRENQGDNRSYYVKCLNKILQDGIIKIAISDKGKIWTNPNYKDKGGNLIKFNVQINGYGYIGRYYYDRYVDAECVLKSVAKFISNPNIIDLHVKSMQVHGSECVECSKCNGKGHISAFSHVCQGICFDCYGSKYIVKKYTVFL